VTAPDHQIIREVQRRLRGQQGQLGPRQPMPILDQVVGTVLSQHTSDVNAGRAFARLKARFPAWEQAAYAPAGEIKDAIRCGGLARQKADRIKEILNEIDEREGRIDLSRLHDLSDQAAESYLASLPGVGLKTAACVLAFSMGRAAFPVDTHVHRVVTRLGWIPAGTTAEEAYRVGADNDVIAADLGLRCPGKGHEVGHLAARSRRIGHYRRSCHYGSLIWLCCACSAGLPCSLAPIGPKMPRSCSCVTRLPSSSARSSRRSCRGPTGRSCRRWPGCCPGAASGSCA
jgi:endonuclease III